MAKTKEQAWARERARGRAANDDPEEKRTTVVLHGQDLDNLRSVQEIQRTNESDAIRRSLSLARHLLEIQEEGGKIFIERDEELTQLRFL